MSDDYVNNVKLEFNGIDFDDFQSFTDNEETYAVVVELMNKTGFADKTPRYGFSVTANRPVDGYPFDLRKVKGGTATVEYPGIDGQQGKRTSYSGVRSLSRSEGAVDGETPLSETFVFAATKKVEQ